MVARDCTISQIDEVRLGNKHARDWGTQFGVGLDNN